MLEAGLHWSNDGGVEALTMDGISLYKEVRSERASPFAFAIPRTGNSPHCANNDFAFQGQVANLGLGTLPCEVQELQTEMENLFCKKHVSQQ